MSDETRPDARSGADFPPGAALVIGGSGGVGREVCLALARAGSDVALTFRTRPAVAEEVAGRIRALGRRASVHALTLGDPGSVRAAVADAAAAHGRLHTVVVGAGTVATQVMIGEMTAAQWRTVVEQDLNGFVSVVQETLPRLRAAGGGSFVHLGSAGHDLWPERDVLSVAPKAAIEALITGIAREEGVHGIRANSVLLGVIEAGMFLELSRQGAFGDDWVRAVRAGLALKRWGRPEEVADAVVFLASSRAAYVTGQRLSVSGGYGL